MKNTSASSIVGQSWSANEIIETKKDWMDRLFGWWYRYTTPPRAAANASFAKREADRRGRLLSTIAFFLVVIIVAFLPSDPPSALLPSFITLVITTGALLANKAGKTTLAGIIIVAIGELAMIGVLLQPPYTPLTPSVFEEYDYLILIDILAVSLLPTRSIFVLALVNSAFITSHLLYAPRTLAMTQILNADLSQMFFRPIALQFFVAGVVALWVYTATKSNERANRAEMVAALEHTIAQQNTAAEQEKQELEESIQQLIKAHTDAVNGQVMARIPYPPAKVLWPLVGVVNSLWVRQQHTQQTESELQQLQQALDSYAQLIYQASLSPQQPLPLLRTGTAFDSLSLSLKRLQGALLRPNT